MAGITYKEFQRIALANYNKGGDSYVECWDEQDFNRYVDEFGPITKTKLMQMIKSNYEMEKEEEAAKKFYSGEDGTDWSKYEAELTAKQIEEAGFPETAQEIRNEATNNKEEDNMKNTQAQVQVTDFELNGVRYTTTRPGYYYKKVDGKQTRIGKAEYDEAWNASGEAEKAAREAERAQADKEAEQSLKKEKKAQKKAQKAHFATTIALADDKIADVTLTEKQVKFIQLIKDDDFYDNGLQSTIWIDALCDTIADEFNPMAVGAMVSTLREKDLITITRERVNGKVSKYFAFTELGQAVAKELGLE